MLFTRQDVLTCRDVRDRGERPHAQDEGSVRRRRGREDEELERLLGRTEGFDSVSFVSQLVRRHVIGGWRELGEDDLHCAEMKPGPRPVQMCGHAAEISLP